ncbi:hypothetical protein [Sagittula sp. S175]|uniref:hypothetical protein n=1 Tax=Sagittula sp. S175 TaxID=3415129 RepID=UPI003C7D7CC2
MTRGFILNGRNLIAEARVLRDFKALAAPKVQPLRRLLSDRSTERLRLTRNVRRQFACRVGFRAPNAAMNAVFLIESAGFAQRLSSFRGDACSRGPGAV